MAEKGAIVRANTLIQEVTTEEEKKKSNRNLLQAMTTVYTLLEEECPQALSKMQKVIDAVHRFKLANQQKNAHSHQNHG